MKVGIFENFMTRFVLNRKSGMLRTLFFIYYLKLIV
jgi:hypothetical protein